MQDRPRAKIKTVFSVLIPLGFAAWVAIYLLNHLQEFKQAIDWGYWFLAGISVLTLAHFAILGLFSQVILKTFGLRLIAREWFGLSIITTLGNYVLPLRGGAGLRAVYLKKKHGFSFTHFFSTFLSIYLFTLLVNSLAGLSSIIFLYDLPRGIWWSLVLFFGSVLAVTLTLAFVPVSSSWSEKLQLPFLPQLIQAWRTTRAQLGVLKSLFSLAIANYLCLTLMLYLGYRAMNVDLGLPEGALLGAIFGLSGLVSITPGGLGIQEAIVVVSAQAFDITATQGLALALVIRAIILFWTFLLGPVFSYLLLRKPIPLVAEEACRS